VLDLDEPIVVCVSDKVRHPIAGNLILEIDLRDWWPKIVRVEVLVRDDVSQPDFHSTGDILKGLIRPFGLGMPAIFGYDDAPVVVGITVRIQCNLLF